MLLAAALAVLVGLAVGMLGGGGSILTVPILVYVAQVEPKSAIATSLFVVLVTSVVAAIPHALAGHVKWRTAWVFGGTGLVGAYFGGRLSFFLPASILLLAFGGLMLVTAIAMIRGRASSDMKGDIFVRQSGTRLLRFGAEGLAVGLVTGIVGAGGGFVVVPALAMLGGLPMATAVGTSLVVIAMNSFAGFVGHAADVSIPWSVAIAVSVPAVIASAFGARLAQRISDAWLRPIFGWVVLLMAVFMIGRQLPHALREHAVFSLVFVERWPFLVSGLAIGSTVLAMLWYDDKLLGVSTGCAELCRLHRDSALRGSWRLLFLLGIVFGGFVASTFAGKGLTWTHGAFDALVSSSLYVKAPLLLVGGVLIGYGARVAGGCTSGHSIVGMAQGARSSFVASLAFMTGGFATTTLLFFATR
ncbi:MAG: TSUP family transporter [Polyangiaceae bacterium]|nr:TSUP family transporter [Polyangiaceae bacterium]